MSLGAILRGTAVGVLAALVLAVALALVVYHTTLPDRFVVSGLWLADALASGAAGYAAGRGAEAGAAVHGILAALTLTVLGDLVAEWLRVPIGALWGQLALAAVMGLVGGMAAAIQGG